MTQNSSSDSLSIQHSQPPFIVICGATATGKSALAISVAHELGATIVNADSMQIYKGMDIGTAKLSVEEREGIPHEMLDILSVKEDSNASLYQREARAVVDRLIAGNTPVVVVGGTGLYIKSLLDDLNFPETDPVVRAQLELEALSQGGDALHKRLASLDPAAALAIPRENIRRVVRALEVISITGKPFTANLPRQESTKYPQALQFGLRIDRSTLDERIDHRVEKMWAQGFEDEVDKLIEEGLLEGTTAKAAIGYSHILTARGISSDLEKAGVTLADGERVDAREATKIATRQYARRQETWFNRDERIHWLTEPSKEEILKAISL